MLSLKDFESVSIKFECLNKVYGGVSMTECADYEDTCPHDGSIISDQSVSVYDDNGEFKTGWTEIIT
ncbi:MAG TPA: hypothetical protein PKD85_22090 [Saprospiraceae bacterium]|nr:hypothetical protein [Saprospiraceae bacterium]